MGERIAPIPFTTPASIEDAENRMEELLSAILIIETQLGDRDRRTPDGDRLIGDDYWDWKRTAQFARVAKQGQYRQLKTWVRQQREKTSLSTLVAKGQDTATVDPIIVLARALNLLVSLGREHRVTYTNEEWDLIHGVGVYINREAAKMPDRAHTEPASKVKRS